MNKKNYKLTVKARLARLKKNNTMVSRHAIQPTRPESCLAEWN